MVSRNDSFKQFSYVQSISGALLVAIRMQQMLNLKLVDLKIQIISDVCTELVSVFLSVAASAQAIAFTYTK